MKIYSYTQIGKKENNEDSIAHNYNVFLVCDGVGGAVKGEMASKSIAEFICSNYSKKTIGEEPILSVLDNAQDHLNLMVAKEDTLDGMATTIAAVFRGSKGLFTAHAGDSRIYFVRPKAKLFWHTWDHSLVGSLVKNGEITHEEAARHPMKHQILKAFKGNLEGKKTTPEIHFLSDLMEGDIAFICSDGVLETFAHEALLYLLSDNGSTTEEKLDTIQEECEKKSTDNHSAVLLELEKEDCLDFSGYSSEWHSLSSLK
jgi:protein phosphatase